MNKKQMMENYKAMAKNSQRDMKTCIKKYLEDLAVKDELFRAKYEASKFNGCIRFVTECAKEIISGKYGEVADDVCYRIARDYFNDEVWKEEEKSKAKKTPSTKAAEDCDNEDEELEEQSSETSVQPVEKPAKKKLGELDQISMFDVEGFANA